MSVSIQMRFDEAKQFFAMTQAPADKKVTVLFDDTELAKALKQQQFLTTLQNLRGSVEGDLLSGLLAERKQDRKAEHIND